MNKKLSEFEKDQLKEVVNIGAGNAVTALSKLMKEDVNISVPYVEAGKIEKIHNSVGINEDIKTVVLLKILGDVSGVMMLMFPPEGALKLAGALTNNHKKDIKVLDDIDRSALKEVGNMLAGALTESLSKFLGIEVKQSLPDAATDMLGSMIDSVLFDVASASDSALFLKVEFTVGKDGAKGDFLLLFDPEATEKIILSLNSKYS